ncbi:MAG: CHASE3 domain-containing protein [Anaerolineae bacterium]|nr:CHASE3 domain-containing protein [Anaerolineae bacterium]
MMMKWNWSFERVIGSGFLVMILIVIITSVLAYQSISQYILVNQRVSHTLQVIGTLQDLLSTIVDAESGQRGYILTGQLEFLEPYQQGNQTIDELFEQLRTLTLDNSSQLARIDTLAPLVEQRMTFLTQSIGVWLTQGFDAAQSMVASGDGKRAMDQIREAIDVMITEENALLEERNQQASSSARLTLFSLGVLILLTFVFLTIFYGFIVRSIQERKQAQFNALQYANEVQDLYDNAPCGYHSLDSSGTYIQINKTELGWLGYTHDEVIGKKRFGDFITPDSLKNFQVNFPVFKARGWIKDLEFDMVRKDGTILSVLLNATAITDSEGNYVSSRSTLIDVTDRKQIDLNLQKTNQELIRANQELEAFSYSVSHDLRTPLRSIDGFSQALLDDYADKLDTTAQSYLKRVRKAAQRMGELIDDLINLGRISKADIVRENVDLTALCHKVVNDLQRNDPNRKVNIIIDDELKVVGDSHLLKLVLDNLIGNAWKFTGHTDDARIEVTGQRQNGKTVFRVSDNGAGFDMTYANKLFEPFQRLHGYEEFEGTGIGLATVNRIIQRHGGQVWAEGEVGKGAAFYFSL